MPKVLFLEDEEILVDDLPVLLGEEGWEVKSTLSISEALEWLDVEDFDVVLLDIMMPPAENMDAEQLNHGRETGIEVARQMKKRKSDMPIIAFTVLRDHERLAKIREAGVIEIINKPAELDQIVEVLRRVIRGKSR